MCNEIENAIRRASGLPEIEFAAPEVEDSEDDL
jgi:hypothetical protein